MVDFGYLDGLKNLQLIFRQNDGAGTKPLAGGSLSDRRLERIEIQNPFKDKGTDLFIFLFGEAYFLFELTAEQAQLIPGHLFSEFRIV